MTNIVGAFGAELLNQGFHSPPEEVDASVSTQRTRRVLRLKVVDAGRHQQTAQGSRSGQIDGTAVARQSQTRHCFATEYNLPHLLVAIGLASTSDAHPNKDVARCDAASALAPQRSQR